MAHDAPTVGNQMNYLSTIVALRLRLQLDPPTTGLDWLLGALHAHAVSQPVTADLLELRRQRSICNCAHP